MSKESIFTDVLTKKYRHEDFCRFTAEFFSGMNFIAPNFPQRPDDKYFAEIVKDYFVIGE